MPSPRKSPARLPRRPTHPRPFDPKSLLTSTGIGKTFHHYGPRQALLSLGDRANAVLYIQDGKLQLSVLSQQGEEAAIALLSTGDFLGEGCIASDQPLRPATLLQLRTALT